MVNTTPENYLSTITESDPDYIVFIDAVKNKEEHGTISILSEKEISNFAISTHTSSILLIIDFLKNCIDADYFVVGIRIKNNNFGEGISKEVLESADRFIEFCKFE